MPGNGVYAGSNCAAPPIDPAAFGQCGNPAYSNARADRDAASERRPAGNDGAIERHCVSLEKSWCRSNLADCDFGA
jgi:hypothetical protein